MDNYFKSYITRNKINYIFPEVNNIKDSFKPIIYRESNPVTIDSYRATDKFNPYVYRVSKPVVLEVFVYGPDELFYEVTQGIYTVNKGTLKMKVKKKYGE